MKGVPRVVSFYPFQKKVDVLVGYSDSNWAACSRTAKSTSGGALVRGSHLLKSWAPTQKTVALSSGEAELLAAAKMAIEAMGL